MQECCQEEWDKCGLQIGNRENEVHKMMIALNVDTESIQEAIDNGCDMLISHHPFLLDKIENIDKDHFMGECIYKAILNDLAVYSAHTNLDKLSMNHWLIKELDVTDIKDGDASGITKVAKLNKSMKKEDFIQYVKKVYNLRSVRLTVGFINAAIKLQSVVTPIYWIKKGTNDLSITSLSQFLIKCIFEVVGKETANVYSKKFTEN